MPALNRYRYEIALLAVVIVWGTNFPILKHAISAMDPFVLNIFRFIASGIALGSVFLFSKRERAKFSIPVIRAYSGKIFALGFFGFFVYQMTFMMGIDRTGAGNAALIMSAAPIWTALSALAFRVERFRPLSWIGLGISFAGALIVIIFGTSQISMSTASLAGNIIMVFASICWGVYTTLTRPVTKHVSPLVLTFCGIIAAFPFLLLVGLPYLNTVDWSLVTWEIWVAIAYSGALSTGLTVYVWNHAVREVGASHTASFGNLVPLIALITSALYIDEPITAAQIVGGVLIISGLVTMRQARVQLART